MLRTFRGPHVPRSGTGNTGPPPEGCGEDQMKAHTELPRVVKQHGPCPQPTAGLASRRMNRWSLQGCGALVLGVR